jgi:hypothetical protein
VNEFVEQCLREWRRLGVPGRLAEEMAADLASDLEEAQAEGVSAEQYLGRSASDPRSFAASWAAERGIVPRPGREAAGRRPPALAALTALAAIVLVVATLLLATGEPKVALTTSATPPRLSTPPAAARLSLPPGHRVQASAAAPVEWILLLVAIAALGLCAWLWLRWGRSRLPAAPA